MQNKTYKGTLLVSKSLPVINSSSVNRLFSARNNIYCVSQGGKLFSSLSQPRQSTVWVGGVSLHGWVLWIPNLCPIRRIVPTLRGWWGVLLRSRFSRCRCECNSLDLLPFQSRSIVIWVCRWCEVLSYKQTAMLASALGYARVWRQVALPRQASSTLFDLFPLNLLKEISEVFAQHLLLVGDFQNGAECRVISRCRISTDIWVGMMYLLAFQ